MGRNGGPGGRFLNFVAVVRKKSFNVKMIREKREMSVRKKGVIFVLIDRFVALGLSL